MDSKNQLSLSNLPIGDVGKVEYIKDNSLKRRFLDLGLIPNTKVKTERYSPAGNPIAFNIRGTIIAIRREEAENILIRKI
ncbi:FeoA family protein [Clostridium sp. Cult2]|uniref:FeoA family protein n=1 Tax=Clostridium sp. Cult2 TaxID=2079003 RepID=UPI001F3F3056|nr:FeoA family protein [Clostridium sp. Cult2]MCF6465322.1 ferrous iron transport protein A [Clostridium sp. Cult2]